MAFTAEQLAALEAAAAQGILRVRSGDKDVTYQSIDQMHAVITRERAAIAAASGTARPPRRYVEYSRG